MNEESATPQENKPVYEWDFFLSHPGADLDAAKNLFAKLNPPAKVFLDDECLRCGDVFDIELSKAQRASLISLILVTPNTENAYFQREEIAAAIDMARADPRTHRVVPIYLNEKQIPKDRIPFGLRLRHSVYIPETGDFTETVNRLLKTLETMKQLEVKKDQVVVQQQIAIAKITGSDSSKAEFLAGLGAATRFNHSILYTLTGLFVVILVLLIVGLLVLPPIIGMPFGILLGAFETAILFFILRIISRSLDAAGQIAQGRINGG